MEHREDDGDGFIWFLAGLGVGAAIAILYAPRAGREIRGFISETAEAARDFLSDTVTGSGHEAHDRELLDEATEMVSGGPKAAQE